jgi:uncharacterized protein
MYLESHKDGVSVKVRVIPKASRNEVVGQRGEYLCIKICAAPEKGQANAELLRFLGKTIGSPPSGLRIIRGTTAREKTILVPLHDLDFVRNKLQGANSAE